mmetsp:Transcript_9212/g.8144  ORF Transcript_9212/g.8144 Transcript_9212/m.8144 type:complete len:115 (+) Transcript_9212:42-386(+)
MINILKAQNLKGILNKFNDLRIKRNISKSLISQLKRKQNSKSVTSLSQSEERNLELVCKTFEYKGNKRFQRENAYVTRPAESFLKDLKYKIKFGKNSSSLNIKKSNLRRYKLST